MCTVTFLPLDNSNFILTSNRDEQRERETLAPQKYIEHGIEMVYPKDKIAGGTWIGVSSKKRLVCVLNGAYEKHTRKKYYKKSRGVLAKNLLKTENLLESIESIDLEGIEPFTIIIVDWSKSLNLYELVWDESQKYFNKLINEPKIWSSSTLYSNEVKNIRKLWFEKWILDNPFSTEDILEFHHSKNGTPEQYILMKRPTVETVSITSVKKENDVIEMLYEDVIHSKKTAIYF